MYSANFLHIYQPPTQSEDIVRKVADESYRKIVDVLESVPQAKITLNINACLTDQLYRYGLTDVIDGLGRLAERGQIEFTGSAMYHPILPLIPLDEARRQIELNTVNNRRYFGDVYQPRGFFPPEMCYSFDVADLATSMGFGWIIMDEIGYDGRLGQVRDDVIYELDGLKGRNVFFRDRAISSAITNGVFTTSSELLATLRAAGGDGEYLLTATDGEMYGHHHPGYDELLREVLDLGTPPTVTISELLDRIKGRATVKPVRSSWSAWEDEVAGGVPYPQWRYPGNEIHDLQWRLTYAVTDMLDLLPAESDRYSEARNVLDEALHSCQYWWASCRPWWGPEMIERGADLLLRAVALVAPAIPSDKVVGAREMAGDAVRLTQEWQASGKAARLQKQYLAEHKQVTTMLTFGEIER